MRSNVIKDNMTWFHINWNDIIQYKKLPVAPRKAVAEVSKIGNL